MRTASTRAWIIALLVALSSTALIAVAAEPAKSQWVYPGADGKLVYKTTPAGDRMMDFSYAGYMGGGVVLPMVPVKRTVEPSGVADKDDTAAIQAAIDEVAKLPLVDGFHGAVQLAPGNFTCGSTINLRESGIVLRGSGSGGDEKTATTIKMVGGKHAAIVIGAGRGRQAAGPSIDDNEPAGGREPSRREPPGREDSAAVRTTDRRCLCSLGHIDHHRRRCQWIRRRRHDFHPPPHDRRLGEVHGHGQSEARRQTANLDWLDAQRNHRAQNYGDQRETIHARYSAIGFVQRRVSQPTRHNGHQNPRGSGAQSRRRRAVAHPMPAAGNRLRPGPVLGHPRRRRRLLCARCVLRRNDEQHRAHGQADHDGESCCDAHVCRISARRSRPISASRAAKF